MRTREATAWDSIGWDDGPFRVKGGRVYWQAVMYNCANNGSLVKLSRLVHGREVSRYVLPDSILVFSDSSQPLET